VDASKEVSDADYEVASAAKAEAMDAQVIYAYVSCQIGMSRVT